MCICILHSTTVRHKQRYTLGGTFTQFSVDMFCNNIINTTMDDRY
jgi:hypothetical protein